MNNLKIKSKFYVIMGDSNPIYVGYTNRTVRQRFKEHLRNKDFSKYNFVKVSELSDYEVDFNFTWDYFIIQKDADIVSNVEEYLINKFGTQDSPYQMIINGGQNWNDIKHFVLNNKGNPKFRGMSGSEIKKYLEDTQNLFKFIRRFVSRMVSPEKESLKNMVRNMFSPEEISLTDFAGSMISPDKKLLSSFVLNITSPEENSLVTFVGSMIKPEERSLKSFTNNMIPQEESSLHSFIRTMIKSEEESLSNFAYNMRFPEEISLMNFTGDMKERKIKND